MADPITREQVERARASVAATGDEPEGITAALGHGWLDRIPVDVKDAWHCCTPCFRAALTRWRDELVAAEPVRRVARWDAESQRYALTPPYESREYDFPMSVAHVAGEQQARAWGYEIEGGPEPIQTLSRCPDCGGPECCAECGYLFGALTGDDGPGDAPVVRSTGKPDTNCAPERPAPRFKVGDWVRVVSNGAVYQVGEVAIPFGGAYYFRETGGAENSWAAPALEPASPPAPEVAPRGWTRHSSGSYWCLHCNATGDAPGGQDCANCGGLGWRGEPGATPERAPEVVDVPQPIVKRLRSAEAQWCRGETVMRIEVDESGYVYAPLALLRAMLEAIDAQQGGAS